jgi:polyisoprenoid-binding protein YceI
MTLALTIVVAFPTCVQTLQGLDDVPAGADNVDAKETLVRYEVLHFGSSDYWGGGPNPFDSKETIIGFRATAAVKRSDFGLGKYVPIVSDETHIVISVAFKKT